MPAARSRPFTTRIRQPQAILWGSLADGLPDPFPTICLVTLRSERIPLGAHGPCVSRGLEERSRMSQPTPLAIDCEEPAGHRRASGQSGPPLRTHRAGDLLLRRWTIRLRPLIGTCRLKLNLVADLPRQWGPLPSASAGSGAILLGAPARWLEEHWFTHGETPGPRGWWPTSPTAARGSYPGSAGPSPDTPVPPSLR